MKLKACFKSFLLFLCASSLITACGSNFNPANISGIDFPAAGIKLDNTNKNFSSIFPVIQQSNNGGLSRIIQRKNKEFIVVYGSETFGDKHIYLTSSQDARSWSVARKITNSPLSDTNPAIIEDKNETLRIFYSSNQNGDWEIFQIFSKDGKKWSEPASVQLDYQGVYNPHIIENPNGELILVYQAAGNGIFTARSTDGKGWSSSQVSPEGRNPFIQLLNNGSYATVYENQKNIYLRESNDLSNWSEPKKLTDFSEVKDPRLSVAGNNLLLTYTARDSKNNWNIFSQKTDNLNNWSEAIKLTTNNFNNTKPSIFSNNKMSILSWTVENNQAGSNNKTIYVGDLDSY